MPSKSTAKVSLAQRLVGIQQIIAATLRQAQAQLLDTLNRADYAAVRAAVEAVERAVRMRELVDQLLQLAKGSPAQSTTAPTAEPAAQAKTKQVRSVKKAAKAAKKAARKVRAQAKTSPQTATAAAQPAAPKAAAAASRRGPAPRGVRTPEREFIVPILQVLAEKGGQAESTELVQSVLERMRPILKPGDFETPAKTNQPRWKTTLYLARALMVRQGLLRSDSPRGVWAISEAGLEYLRQQLSADGSSTSESQPS